MDDRLLTPINVSCPWPCAKLINNLLNKEYGEQVVGEISRFEFFFKSKTMLVIKMAD